MELGFSNVFIQRISFPLRGFVLVNATALNGRKVLTSDAHVLGEVEGIEVTPETWSVTHLRVLLTKASAEELRFEKPILWDVVLSLPVRLVKAFGDVINLNISFAEVSTLAESS
jgi:sporulation protein YlmC with PRC-barrel domain